MLTAGRQAVITDASQGRASQHKIDEGILQNFLTEFQKNAVDGVLQSAVPVDRLPSGLHPSKNDKPMLLKTKAPATKQSMGYVHYPGAGSKYA